MKNEPAFPIPPIELTVEGQNIVSKGHGGLTKLEYFAGLAMGQMLIACTDGGRWIDHGATEAAKISVAGAKALIAELDGEGG